MGPDYETLEEICSIYQKSAYEKGLIIKELEEENRKLKEANKNLIIQRDAYCKDYERVEEENRKLKEENRKLSEGKIIYASEKEQRHYVDILEENKKLKEELEHIHGFDSFLIAHGFKLEDLYKTLEK